MNQFTNTDPRSVGAHPGAATGGGVTVLDPTSEAQLPERIAPPRLASLKGSTIALLDISKPRGNVFLNEVERQLQELGALTKRYVKPTYTKPAPLDLRMKIAQECEAAIEALAD